MSEGKDGTSKAVKLIAAITALLVAIGTLVGAITVTLGKGDDGSKYSYTTIVLDSPEKYEQFINSHPG
jgi:hypothetical protein